jgi:hypothetical protein
MRSNLGWIVIASVACTRHNPEVCCVSMADCHAQQLPSITDCPMGMVCVNNLCTTQTAMPQCTTDQDCTGTTTPHCAPDHTCVGCLMNNQCSLGTPTCDSMTRTCRACAADSDCDSQVCDLTGGTCLLQSTILYAAPTGLDTSNCSMATPCTITRAITIADSIHQTIKLEAGNYTASPTISGKTLFIDGRGASLAAVSTAASGGAFTIVDGAQLRIAGLTITNLNPNGNGVFSQLTAAGAATPMIELDSVTIDCTGATVFANPATVIINGGRYHVRTTQYAFMALSPSTATIDRAFFDGGDGLVAIAAGAVIRVTNTVIANQTGSDGAFTGGSLGGNTNGSVFVSFSTVVNSLVKCGTGTPACAGGVGFGSCIDNSIIFNPANTGADTVTGAACVANYAVVFPQSTSLTGANNKLNSNPLLKDAPNGDYHLAAGSPAIQAADPLATDAIDFDGVARPAHGSRRCVGAFEFTQ